MAYKYYQGFFKPINPSKYIGNVKNIVYRSSLEFKFFRKLDADPNVVHWGSEEFFVPYVSPKDNRVHRYFVDIFYQVKDGTKYVIEIKPSSQMVPPKKGKKKQQTYLKECLDYAINQAKWQSCAKYCKDRGFIFQIISEKEIG